MLTGEGRAHHGDILREATRLIEAGKLAPRVDPRHFTLSTVGEAHRVLREDGSPWCRLRSCGGIVALNRAMGFADRRQREMSGDRRGRELAGFNQPGSLRAGCRP